MPRYRDIPYQLTSREAALLREELEAENDMYGDMPDLEDILPDLEDNPDYYGQLVTQPSIYERSPREYERLRTGRAQRDYDNVQLNRHSSTATGQLTSEAADLLTLGRRVGQGIHGYDPDSEFLRDRYGREYRNTNSGQRIRNNWLSNFAYNTVGYRGNAVPVDDRLATTYGPHEPVQISRYEERGRGTEPGQPISHRYKDEGGRIEGKYIPNERRIRVRGGDDPALQPTQEYQGDMHYHASNINRPKMKQPEYGGCMKFSNSEFISNIICLSTGAFSLNSFSVNAALYSTFPVLSQIASSFIYYKFTKLQFRYVSTSSDSLAQTDASLGTVCMMLDENSASSAPGNLVVMQNYPGSKSFKPSLSLVTFPVNVDNPIVDWFFCRTNPTVNQNDPRLTDMFNFYVATQGMTAGYSCGELHVDYEVELCSPFLNSSINGNQVLYYRQQLGLKAGTGSATCDPVSGTGYGNMGMTIQGSSTGNLLVITFPGYLTTGFFMIQLNMPGGILMTQDPYQWGDLVSSNITPILTPPVYTSNITIIQPHCMNFNSTTSDILYEYSYGPGGYQVLSNASTRQSCNVITGTPGTTISGNNWDSTICVTIYIQLGAVNTVSQSQPATMTFPGFQSAGSAAAPGTFFQGDLLISQVNPNFRYAWSSGQGISNP